MYYIDSITNTTEILGFVDWYSSIILRVDKPEMAGYKIRLVDLDTNDKITVNENQLLKLAIDGKLLYTVKISTGKYVCYACTEPAARLEPYVRYYRSFTAEEASEEVKEWVLKYERKPLDFSNVWVCFQEPDIWGKSLVMSAETCVAMEDRFASRQDLTALGYSAVSSKDLVKYDTVVDVYLRSRHSFLVTRNKLYCLKSELNKSGLDRTVVSFDIDRHFLLEAL